MGSISSIPLPRYSCCIRPQNPNRCKENHAGGVPKKSKSHRRNISATFSFLDGETDYSATTATAVGELVNVNVATEEELMTLSGINRQTAQNIVEYRRQIGGFRRVEDLALVCGVGAERLEQLRCEICVSYRRALCQSSSSTSSGIDIPSLQDNISGCSGKSLSRPSSIAGPPKVNVNTSNVFQLMKVKFITQALAEKIVERRDLKGPYSTLDDLLKVRCIKPWLLSAIRPYLSVCDEVPAVPVCESVLASKTFVSENTKNTHCHSRNRSLDLNCLAPGPRLDGTQEDLISLYGPPMLGQSFCRRRVSKCLEVTDGVLRVATWNLQRCSADKVDNIGVREVVAMTILENWLSIVAVQDLTDKTVLQKICDELNEPSIAAVKKWPGRREGWSCVTSPPIFSDNQGEVYVGFLYDTSRGVELTESRLVQQNTVATPFIAHFTVQGQKFVVLNNFTRSSGLECDVERRWFDEPEIGSTDANVIVMGSSDTSQSAAAVSAAVINAGYSPTVCLTTFTDITTTGTKGSFHADNIWLGSTTTSLFNGKSEVVRDGLASPWIPNGWTWGGLVSSHCPVWAELRL